MERKKSATSPVDVAERAKTPLAQRLSSLITDTNALKDYLGCSAQAVNQFRLGISRPSLENLCKIADFYGVSTDYLLGLTNVSSVETDVQVACKTTGLSEDAIYQLSRLDTVANGNRAINTLLGSPKLYNFASFLATFLYGGWVEEFTGRGEGHISSLRKIDADSEIFDRYIRPAMLVQINQVLTEIRNHLEEKTTEGGGGNAVNQEKDN